MRPQELQKLVSRRAVVFGGVQAAAGFALLARLYYLQFIHGAEFKMLAEGNRAKLQLLIPPRGIITDRYGVALFGLYAVCLWFGLARPLYATMFVLALIMELYGTAMGNWVWASTAPWVNLSAANPPFSAGAFYCALDLLVLGMLHRMQTRSSELAVEATTKG